MLYDVDVQRDVRIPTGEPGVTLSGDLFLPVGAGPVPLLLMALPYRRDMIAMNGSYVERWFAERGFATLLIDLRGTGSSDGAARPAFDPGEADDCVAAMDWAVAQPWCDGNVGMWGHSYGAMTAMRAASHRPPALKAILVWQGTADPGYDFVHPGGARGALGPLGLWAMGSLLNQLLPPLDDFADEREQARWRARLAAEPVLLDMFAHGPQSPVWAQRRIDAGAIEVPALCLSGWRDLFGDGMIRAYEAMRGPKRLVVGPWMHSSPQDSPFAPIDFAHMALDWWDRWLRGGEAVEEPQVRVFVQGARPRWVSVDGAHVRERAQDVSGWQRSEPSQVDHAVGTLSGLWAFPFGAFGMPLDQHDDDARSLCYTSPPLAAPLLIYGRPRVDLSHAWPQVSVKLAVVDGFGRSTLVCPGDTATCFEVPAGHRLRLAIAPADFPRVWPVAAEGWPDLLGFSLPVLDEAAEIEMAVPEPVVFEGDFEMPAMPVWELGSEQVTGTVSLRLGIDGTVTSRPPHRKHVLRSTQEVTATACRTDPAAAAINGSLHATVDTETGRHIEVGIEFTVTAAGARADCHVVAEGQILLEEGYQI